MDNKGDHNLYTNHCLPTCHKLQFGITLEGGFQYKNIYYIKRTPYDGEIFANHTETSIGIERNIYLF